MQIVKCDPAVAPKSFWESFLAGKYDASFVIAVLRRNAHFYALLHNIS